MLHAFALLFALAVSAPAAHAETAEEACTPDAQRLCQDVIPDEQKVKSCLLRNRRALTPACRAVFSQPTRGRHRPRRH